MTASPPESNRAAVEQGLRRVHVGVLGIIVACALVAAFSADPDAPPPTRVDATTYAAVALALTSAVTRRRRPAEPANVRSHVLLTVVSLLSAAGVGCIGAAAALAGAARTSALAIVLAGAIFALRPPLGIAAGSGASRA